MLFRLAIFVGLGSVVATIIYLTPVPGMDPPKKPSHLFRWTLITAMILSAAAFLHLCNYRPQQTFLSCDRPCHHLDWPMICRVSCISSHAGLCHWDVVTVHCCALGCAVAKTVMQLSAGTMNAEDWPNDLTSVYSELRFYESNETCRCRSCGKCPENETDCLADFCVFADGHHRGIFAVNRQLPGPSIQVCENDILVIDVVNRLPGKAAAIHWRGQTQRETPCMDGVPLVTQCPIPSYTTFQYKFRAAVPGTHLWHSHSGADTSNGIFGSLIVRQAAVSEPHRSLYDVDDPNHVVLISHWHHSVVTDTSNKKPALLLVNGRGRHESGPKTPLAEFTVTPGSRHRFRLANAGGGGSCAISITIDDHPLLLIALDGNPIQPKSVKSITLGKGERADVILEANRAPSSYHLYVSTSKSCGSSPIHGSAVIKYRGADKKPSTAEKLVEIHETNHLRMSTDPAAKCGTVENVCLAEIASLKSLPAPLNDIKTDLTIYLPVVQQTLPPEASGSSAETVVLSVNNATFTYPSSPLLTQGSDVPEDLICSAERDPTSRGLCRQFGGGVHVCECVNLRQIPLGATVEIILLDQVGREDLVYHLHGYSFYVVAARKFTQAVDLEEIKMLNTRGLLFTRNLVSPPMKDTVMVPKFGAVALRFKADNPGYWMLRDENALEWTRGLDVILQVGEPADMPTFPQDFPKCGSFVGPDYFLI